jgi:hypothetical protein
MSENVGASTSRNPKGLHGLYGDNFNLKKKLSKYVFLLLQIRFRLPRPKHGGGEWPNSYVAFSRVQDLQILLQPRIQKV